MPYCLVKPLADKFKAALKDGTIKPDELSSLTSAERHSFFADLLGEDQATKVNSLFESKLLLKDKQTAMINWAKQLTGIKPEIRNDLISRIERMDKVLDPAAENAFLSDLAATRLGTKVTFEEAKHITEISQKLLKSKEGFDLQAREWKDQNARDEYGAARVAMQKYLGEVKNTAKPSLTETFKQSPVAGISKMIYDIAAFAKSMKSTLDDSAVGRQNFKAIFTNPKIWAKNTVGSFSDIWKQMKLKGTDDQVLDGIKASVYSRPRAMDGTYQRAKLGIGIEEEAFPSSLPEKIPVLGRFFKASETAFNGMAIKMRADIADRYFEIAEKNGVDLNDPIQAESIGKIVNSLTGRGHLGKLERVAEGTNAIFFSPRSLKSNLDILTAHGTDKLSPFARKMAVKNTLKVISGTATALMIAKAIAPNAVTFDTKSPDFGKIKIGDTRIDVTGGAGSILVLASRLASLAGQKKKFGQRGAWDYIGDFAGNKLSPMASLVRDLYRGEDFYGKKITPVNLAKNLLAPLPLTNVEELINDKKSAPLLLAILADALGFATNTYSSKGKK